MRCSRVRCERARQFGRLRATSARQADLSPATCGRTEAQQRETEQTVMAFELSESDPDHGATLPYAAGGGGGAGGQPFALSESDDGAAAGDGGAFALSDDEPGHGGAAVGGGAQFELSDDTPGHGGAAVGGGAQFELSDDGPMQAAPAPAGSGAQFELSDDGPMQAAPAPADGGAQFELSDNGQAAIKATEKSQAATALQTGLSDNRPTPAQAAPQTNTLAPANKAKSPAATATSTRDNEAVRRKAAKRKRREDVRRLKLLESTVGTTLRARKVFAQKQMAAAINSREQQWLARKKVLVQMEEQARLEAIRAERERQKSARQQQRTAAAEKRLDNKVINMQKKQQETQFSAARAEASAQRVQKSRQLQSQYAITKDRIAKQNAERKRKRLRATRKAARAHRLSMERARADAEAERQARVARVATLRAEKKAKADAARAELEAMLSPARADSLPRPASAADMPPPTDASASDVSGLSGEMEPLQALAVSEHVVAQRRIASIRARLDHALREPDAVTKERYLRTSIFKSKSDRRHSTETSSTYLDATAASGSLARSHVGRNSCSRRILPWRA